MTPTVGFLPRHPLTLRGSLGALLALATNLACEPSTPPTPPVSDEPLAYFTIEPGTLSLTVGQQAQLRATPRAADGSVVAAVPVQWQSSRPEIASINATTGLLTGHAPGGGVISVKGGGREGTANFQVTTVQHALTVNPGLGANVRVTRGQFSQQVTCQDAPCTIQVDAGTLVSLDVLVVGGRSFAGWTGGSCGTTVTCRFVMTGPVSVTANTVVASAATLNLQVYTAIVAQATQSLEGTVELVAGRDAVVRVFAMANQAFNTQDGPPVRVRLRIFHGAVEVATWLLDKPEFWSPTMSATDRERNDWQTYNVALPGALIVPGLRLLAEVDPQGLIPEQNEADNRFPVTGTPREIPVRALPPLRIRFVPVFQSANGLQAQVSQGDLPFLLQYSWDYLPLGTIDASIRGAYAFGGPVLQADDANGAWRTLLTELEALRAVEGAAGTYYHALVRLSYVEGIGGMAPRPLSPVAAPKVTAGRDESVVARTILSHELGHAFGRPHAPCGTTQDLDPYFPDRNAGIGAMGYQVIGNIYSLRVPETYRDVMGYCQPYWASDYTWNQVLQWRAVVPGGAPPMAAAMGVEDGLLVWGQVTAEGVVLEPAFRARPTGEALPARGDWLVEGLDAGGRTLFRQAFDPVEFADARASGAAMFSMILPVGSARLDRLATLRVSGPTARAERTTRPDPSGAADPQATASVGDAAGFSWDSARYPMVLVRNAVSGEVLSFARGGRLRIPPGVRRVDVQLSDGVRTTRRELALP